MPPKKRKTKGRSLRNERRSQDDQRSTANEEDTTNTHVPRESQFNEFMDGLQVASSPGHGANVQDERQGVAIRMLEEQSRIAEEAINLRFNVIIGALESNEAAKNAVWDGLLKFDAGDLGLCKMVAQKRYCPMLTPEEFRRNHRSLDRKVVDELEQVAKERVERLAEREKTNGFQSDIVLAAQKLLDDVKADGMNSRSHGSHASGTNKITWAETPKPIEFSRPTRGTTRRSRSACPKTQQSDCTQKHSSVPRSHSELRNNSDGFSYNIATVTPHHRRDPSQPVAPILRKPKFGETAISMCGSPLLVSSDHVSVASLVLPLADGRVFNVQGNSSTFGDQLRTGLNRRTVDQLKEIKEFINNLVP